LVPFALVQEEDFAIFPAHVAVKITLPDVGGEGCVDAVPQPVVVQELSGFSVEVKIVGVGLDQTGIFKPDSTQADALDLDDGAVPGVQAIGVPRHVEVLVEQSYLVVAQELPGSVALLALLGSQGREGVVTLLTIKDAGEPA
jgi:hypothetical protein